MAMTSAFLLLRSTAGLAAIFLAVFAFFVDFLGAFAPFAGFFALVSGFGCAAAAGVSPYLL
jgi:hypothetical protein